MKKHIYQIVGSNKRIVLPVYDPEMNFMQRCDHHLRQQLKRFVICFVAIAFAISICSFVYYDRQQYGKALLKVEETEVYIAYTNFCLKQGEISRAQLRLATLKYNWDDIVKIIQHIHPKAVNSDDWLNLGQDLNNLSNEASSYPECYIEIGMPELVTNGES